MGLDASYHIIYGYKFDGDVITDRITEACENDIISEAEEEEILNMLENTTKDGLVLVDDIMCGKYQYLGIEIARASDDYGSDIHKELDLSIIEDKNKLGHLIANYLGKYIDKEFFDKQEPKLYFIKRVW